MLFISFLKIVYEDVTRKIYIDIEIIFLYKSI